VFPAKAHNRQTIEIYEPWGRFFVHSFSAENHFPRKIPRNFLEKRFFKTFSAENSIFSQHFWGKIFRGIFPEIFPGKNVRKIDHRSGMHLCTKDDQNGKK
jgi:hypothetical protein